MDKPPTPGPWRIGDLARITGMTVRALRHYEQVGLLPRPARTQGQQRLYEDADLRRLYRIRALRDLGLSLPDIALALEEDAFSLERVLHSHLERVGSDLERLHRLHTVLRSAHAHAQSGTEPDVLPTIEAMALLARHVEASAPRRAKGAGKHWASLGLALRAHMEAGVAPSAPEVLRLARDAQARISRFAAGDESVLASLAQLRATPPPTALRGWDAALLRYLEDAFATLKED